ncbi:hypothetical protein GOP47_0024934 [Adiantum capillus-veneris]|uniref:Myb-like domain-containing protein n=1 Tax=Adiantum capillus-veneris TaxID=13818 RepID=A0A9D4U2Q2_ADICA|nr:hypothetical protein GOP47_0024934 [Adiantum capillus-veneris]
MQPSPKNASKNTPKIDKKKPNIQDRSSTGDTLAYWDWKETEVLIKAKFFLEDAKEAGEVPKFLRKMESWNIISSKCAENGVFRTWKQCIDRWNRVLKDFKTIYDYGRNTPSGCSSYWAIESFECKRKKLLARFSEQVFAIMEVRCGAKHLIEPGDILVDTSDHIIGDDKKEIKSQSKGTEDEDPPLKEKISSHKRHRRGRVVEMLEGLEAPSVKLVDVSANVEEKQAKIDQGLIEITREEYEAARELNVKRIQLEEARLDNERDGNLALFKISNAIESFSSKLHV